MAVFVGIKGIIPNHGHTSRLLQVDMIVHKTVKPSNLRQEGRYNVPHSGGMSLPRGIHLGRCSNVGGSKTNGGRQIGCKPLDKLGQLQGTCLRVKKVLSVKLSSLIDEGTHPEGLIFEPLS